MNHEQVRERLNEWLDGELDASAKAAASAHVESCAECRAEAAALRRLSAALFVPAPAADPRATEAFVARVMGRVEADQIPFWEKFAALFLAPAFGLALAALLFAISMPRVDADAPLGVAASVDAGTVLGMTP